MGVTFTKEQQQVIDLRNRNILVSAAAGSGKTAVLVERIITRLTKDATPLNVDQLLIVTFTEAAAAEMKERIHAAIEKALENEPENVHLQHQATLIHQAQITTIHKFCLSVIKEHFHAIDLDPGFRVGEEGELKLLKQDVVCDVLEAAFQEGDPEFLSFVECFSTGKDDKNLEDLILRLYEFSRSYPNPDTWLDLCGEQYAIASPEDLEEKAYVQELLSEVRESLKQIQFLLECGLKICKEDEGPFGYEKALQSDIEQIETLRGAKNFTQMRKGIYQMEWMKLGSNKGKIVDDNKLLRVKELRKEVKEYIKKLKETYFYETMQNLMEDMTYVHDNIRMLTDLVKRFATQFTEEKRNKNLIDFNDMEQYALQILTREEQGNLVPSEVAEGYQQKFAEVMIDEYQDSNYVQEAILTSVSGVSKGIYNVFMVGDVKQSIYRFRLSRPELFMEKFNSYSIVDSEKQRIDLHKNFRSRREVLDSTNFIFRQIMVPSLGGIDYDERAALYVGADYEERPDKEAEVLLIEVPESKASERIEVEAMAIGRRIKELMTTQTVFDKKAGEYRPIRYGDIVILTRSAKGWTEVFSKVLSDMGIPTYACSKEGYFEAIEIQIALNYLQILDNPRQDIPFTAVLTSMFAGMSSEELANIRCSNQAKTMYDCVCQYAENGEDVWLRDRLCAFLNTFEKFRNCVPYMAIHALLWKVMEETGYYDYVSALPGGEQRAANLEMLLEKAITFEGTSYKGLFHFVRYIEQLKKYAVDYGEANVMDENADVVSLMTIHKSKGLEFPIVFVAGTGKEFNMQDARKSIVVHSELGLGVDAIDPIARTKIPTFLKKIIQLKETRETSAEELRVLYVAMTRAREKLILTGAVEDIEKELDQHMILQGLTDVRLPYYNLVKAKKYLDWILPCIYRNENLEHVPVKVHHITMEKLEEQDAKEQIINQITKEALTCWDTEEVYDAGMKMQIAEQFSYTYPYHDGQTIKQKLSVSELKKRMYMEEEGEEMFREEEVIPLLPKFLQESQELTGASKGTAYHKLLELLDFTKEYDKEMLLATIADLVQSGLLTEEMGTVICPSDILAFLRSPIGKRVQEASRKGKYFAEQPFVIGVEAKEIFPDTESKECVLVQGIVDVYFEEDGQLIVLDYKTDRVYHANELVEHYHTQLEYYAKALQKLTGKPVKEMVIYSFALHEEILCKME
ncbi:MAG: helicase-exonuclease AddAB subunit AddA [Tyzzerella sp.]|nr:helicase-exonuclease AddAB subunit AddA [Tyzzerella sp.]